MFFFVYCTLTLVRDQHKNSCKDVLHFGFSPVLFSQLFTVVSLFCESKLLLSVRVVRNRVVICICSKPIFPSLSQWDNEVPR